MSNHILYGFMNITLPIFSPHASRAPFIRITSYLRYARHLIATFQIYYRIMLIYTYYKYKMYLNKPPWRLSYEQRFAENQ